MGEWTDVFGSWGEHFPDKNKIKTDLILTNNITTTIKLQQ